MLALRSAFLNLVLALEEFAVQEYAYTSGLDPPPSTWFFSNKVMYIRY